MTGEAKDNLNLATVLVRDLMTADVITATPTMELVDAARLLRRHRVRHLPIVNAGGAVVGIISNRDVLVAHRSEGNINGERRIAHVMTRDPVCVNPSTRAAEAATLLLSHRVGCLPVVDRHNRLIGIITEADYVQRFAASFEAS